MRQLRAISRSPRPHACLRCRTTRICRTGSLLFVIATPAAEILSPFIAQQGSSSYPIITVANLLRDVGLVCSDRVAIVARNTQSEYPLYECNLQVKTRCTQQKLSHIVDKRHSVM
jgi:hypothetical protein